MKHMKRVLACLLTIVMITASLTVMASAQTYSGTGEDGLTWSLDTDTGLLTISGAGPMAAYGYMDKAPWMEYANLINRIQIGEGVTSIGNHAFLGATNLMSVSVADTVTSIGAWAFANCSSLTAVELTANSQLTTMGLYTFSGCTSLESFTFPAGLTTIDNATFAGCTSMKHMYMVGDANGTFRVAGNCLVEKATNTVVVGCSGSVIEEGIVAIGDYAFANMTALTTLELPSTLTTIGYGAFQYSGLTTIVIPAGVTEILYATFMGCESLQTIYFAPNSQLTTIGDSAFIDSTAITGAYYCGSAADWAAKVTVGNKNTTFTNVLNYDYQFPADHTPGDINGDGSVNSKDLSSLMKYRANPTTETVVEAALDVNGDGERNSKDMTRLMKYLAGTGVEIF